jgi:hypothetical protein
MSTGLIITVLVVAMILIFPKFMGAIVSLVIIFLVTFRNWILIGLLIWIIVIISRIPL